MNTNKTLLLDLDHTLVRPRNGAKHPTDEKDWEFMPGILDKLREYADAGYRMFIVSNQAGIEYGYTTTNKVTSKMNMIMDAANMKGSSIVNCIFCKSNDETSHYRKPNIGMFELLDKYYHISRSSTIMVGDMDSDKLFAENLGIGYMDINDFLNNKPLTVLYGTN